MAKAKSTVIEIAGIEVTITNPDKIYFPRAGYTKLDLARYYAAVADGALRGIANRPIVLKRYVDGAEGQPFFQKRLRLPPAWEARPPRPCCAVLVVLRTRCIARPLCE